MLENKYYQPELWEFHIGFEYEVIEMCSINGAPKHLQWNKNRLASLGDSKFNWYVKKYPKEFRVKHLDKEDIESLGFSLYKIHAGTTTHEFQSKDARYMITFDHNFGSGWNITIMDEVDFIFFHGYIKNKSELKRILKQVGIYE